MIYKQAARWAAYGNGGATVEDLTQGGFIAVLRAVDSYDPTAEAEIMAADERDRRTRLRTELETVLSSLPDEEQRTIRARYYQGKTLDAIAAAEGISKVTASRWEQAALRRLRHPSRSNRLKAYLWGITSG